MLRLIPRFFLVQKRGLTVQSNPFKAKRVWPPDFSQLSERHKFRLEKRYRRRTKLKWARPRWTKAIQITQLVSVFFVITYGVFFLEWNSDNLESKDPPFKAARDWYKNLADSLWTHTSTEASRSVSQRSRSESESASKT